jgi:hypothetical protein
MALFFLGGKVMQRGKDEAATVRKQADRGPVCEPVREDERSEDPPSDSADEAGERTLEEAGYGYGV